MNKKQGQDLKKIIKSISKYQKDYGFIAILELSKTIIHTFKIY